MIIKCYGNNARQCFHCVFLDFAFCVLSASLFRFLAASADLSVTTLITALWVNLLVSVNVEVRILTAFGSDTFHLSLLPLRFSTRRQFSVIQSFAFAWLRPMETPNAIRSCGLLISRALSASLEKMMFFPFVTVTNRFALLYNCRRAFWSVKLHVNVFCIFKKVTYWESEGAY